MAILVRKGLDVVFGRHSVYEADFLDTGLLSGKRSSVYNRSAVWKSDDKSFGTMSFGIVSLLMASALSPQLTALPFTSVQLACQKVVEMIISENS
jgi:hypothetical protein